MLGTPGKHHGAASRLLRKGEASAGLEGKHSTRQEIFGARTDAAFCARAVRLEAASQTHSRLWAGEVVVGGFEALAKVGGEDAVDARVLGGARLGTSPARHYKGEVRVGRSNFKNPTYDNDAMAWCESAIVRTVSSPVTGWCTRLTHL